MIDGVTRLFSPKKAKTFLINVTTLTLSVFSSDRLSSVLVNIYILTDVSAPGWCHPQRDATVT